MADKPNIMLILTDHFRPDAVGSSTPNLTSLADGGVQFANAYCASPLCRKVFDELAWECKPHPFAEEDTPDGFIGRRGVEFIEGYDCSQPLYLNLSFIGPHPPYWHPGELQHNPEAMSEPLGSGADAPLHRGSVKYQALSLTAKRKADKQGSGFPSRSISDVSRVGRG
jgi:hypothetical protein